MAEVNMGTLYDLNKVASAKEKVLTETELNKKLIDFHYFVEKEERNSYYMLLCHERRDYTIFDCSKNTFIAKDLKECLLNRGEVVSINKINHAYEIWIRKTSPIKRKEDKDFQKEDFVYYFFPYDLGVIKVGE